MANRTSPTSHALNLDSQNKTFPCSEDNALEKRVEGVAIPAINGTYYSEELFVLLSPE